MNLPVPRPAPGQLLGNTAGVNVGSLKRLLTFGQYGQPPSYGGSNQMREDLNMVFETMTETIEAKQSSVASTPLVWRCFHCDEILTTAAAAQAHFGTRETQDAFCTVSPETFRHMELELARYREEDTELHRALHAKDSEMAQAVKKAEEEGYARGLLGQSVLLAEKTARPDLYEVSRRPPDGHQTWAPEVAPPQPHSLADEAMQADGWGGDVWHFPQRKHFTKVAVDMDMLRQPVAFVGDEPPASATLTPRGATLCLDWYLYVLEHNPMFIGPSDRDVANQLCDAVGRAKPPEPPPVKKGWWRLW